MLIWHFLVYLCILMVDLRITMYKHNISWSTSISIFLTSHIILNTQERSQFYLPISYSLLLLFFYSWCSRILLPIIFLMLEEFPLTVPLEKVCRWQIYLDSLWVDFISHSFLKDTFLIDSSRLSKMFFGVFFFCLFSGLFWFEPFVLCLVNP